MHILEEKQQLRESITTRIKRTSKQELEAEGRSVSRRLLDELSPEIKIVCAYIPLPDEVDISLLLTELLKRKIELALPCFYKNKLVFRSVESLSNLHANALRILEPSEDESFTKEEKIDLVLVPGRAFDRHGHRLGRGNGGYDTWIIKQRMNHPRTRYWGISLESQLVDEVPMEPHDQTMDAIVTARGMVFGTSAVPEKQPLDRPSRQQWRSNTDV